MKQVSPRQSVFTTLLFFFSFGSAWSQVAASWALIENKFSEPQQHQAQLSLTNEGTAPISTGWKLYFNTIFISVRSQTLDSSVQLRHLQGDFFVLEGQTPLLPSKQPFSIIYQSRGAFLKNSYPPEGLILVHADGRVEEISSYQTQQLTEAQLKQMAPSILPIPTSANRFEENRALFPLTDSQIAPYLPTPTRWKYSAPPVLVEGAFLVEGAKEFEPTRAYLAATLAKGYRPIGESHGDPLRIRLEKVDSLAKEGYTLQALGREVRIQAATAQGALHGAQSFLALLPAEFWKEEGISSFLLPQVDIEDKPAYGYRGLFLDVARNFQSKEQVLKLLELMSFYKLNVFHFNLANDEGWRIEIPGLPELTSFGGRRGFSEDESSFLWPYYASGADPERSASGSGFYSMADFQEILTFAKERHIDVIPEVGVPAHSRAAILAMENRYRTYMDLGKKEEALRYRLADPEDQSRYLSAQNFTGNTVCVCQESTFAFYEKVVQEISKSYAAAGLPATTWHSGGDEVPRGVWTASPICADFLAKNPKIKQEELADYFRVRTARIVQKYGWKMGGWEEIGQTHQGNQVQPNPKFGAQDWKLYAWNAVAGWGGEDMAYRLANAGYPVVICSSANFYFDLAYSWDPDERGHSWSGVVDMYQSWKAVPGKLYLSHDQTIEGAPWSWSENRKTFTPLSEQGKKNMLGVSGQVWTETVKGPEMLEYYLFPKMLGYVERAWKGDPDWSTRETEDEMKAYRAQEWNQFVNLVGKKEMPKMETLAGGLSFRLPRPGVKVLEERVLVNAGFPGMLIRYTDSGEEPTEASPIYREPIYFRSGYTPRFKLFMPSGKSGRSAGID